MTVAVKAIPAGEGPEGNKPVFSRDDWDGLTRAIQHFHCTPFFGPDACLREVPARAELAKEWAEDYPFEDMNNLARVAQFLAVTINPMDPNYRLVERLQALKEAKEKPDLDQYRLWANLELPVYITTNYDGFLEAAIATNPMRKPNWDFCRWKPTGTYSKSELAVDQAPRSGTPLVYYLFGHMQYPESLVLTEKDYLDFLVNVTRRPELFPGAVEKAFTNSYLLFLGFRLFDLDFWVLLQLLSTYLRRNIFSGVRPHICVQLVDLDSEARRKMAEEYLGKFCWLFDTRIYPGRCDQFVRELENELAARKEGRGRD